MCSGQTLSKGKHIVPMAPSICRTTSLVYVKKYRVLNPRDMLFIHVFNLHVAFTLVMGFWFPGTWVVLL